MAKYISNPREVDAFKIKEVRPHASYGSGAGGFHLHFDNGGQNNATAEMCAHMTPKVGDYWVIHPDGYVYLNPREVFEREYSPKLDETEIERSA
jgi:hypothetical protein